MTRLVQFAESLLDEGHLRCLGLENAAMGIWGSCFR